MCEGLVHEDRHYHTGPFVVTVRQCHHDGALDAHPARARPSRFASPTAYDGAAADLMIALHAWRSADSIRRFRELLSGPAADRRLERHRHLRIHRARSGARLAFARLRRSAGRAAGSRAAARAGAVSAQGSGGAPVGSPAATCRSRRATRSFDVAVIGHLRDVKDPLRAAAGGAPPAGRLAHSHRACRGRRDAALGGAWRRPR